MATKKTGKIQNYNYIEGNTVRKIRVLEDPRKEQHFEDYRHVSPSVRRNREKAAFMNKGYVMFLIAAVIATFMLCMDYLQLQSSINGSNNRISSLEKQLNNLKSDNDATYNRIETSVDLDEVKRIAVDELGMVYAKEHQVVLYDSEESDYVKQYDEIPDAKTSMWDKILNHVEDK